MTEQEKVVILKKREEILKKYAIIPVKQEAGKFLSSTFTVPKKSDDFRPVINLKKLNSCVEYKHLKIDELLNELLEKDNFLLQTGPRECLFFSTSSQGHSKIRKVLIREDVVPFFLPVL